MSDHGWVRDSVGEPHSVWVQPASGPDSVHLIQNQYTAQSSSGPGPLSSSVHHHLCIRLGITWSEFPGVKTQWYYFSDRNTAFRILALGVRTRWWISSQLRHTSHNSNWRDREVTRAFSPAVLCMMWFSFQGFKTHNQHGDKDEDKKKKGNSNSNYK